MMLLKKLGERLRTAIGPQTAPHAVCAESVESRLMRSDTFLQSWTTNSGSLTQFSNYDLFAAVAVGDYGYEGGLPTLVVGDGSSNTDGSYVAWDADLYDGFDSSWRQVQLIVDFSGTDGLSFQVGQESGAEHTGGSCSVFSSITIRASVAYGGLKMSWDDVSIEFYRSGSRIETLALGGGPVADTLDDPWASGEESYVTVTPSATDYDKIVVTGEVRLQAAEGTYPWGDDIFGDVMIDAGGC